MRNRKSKGISRSANKFLDLIVCFDLRSKQDSLSPTGLPCNGSPTTIKAIPPKLFFAIKSCFSPCCNDALTPRRITSIRVHSIALNKKDSSTTITSTVPSSEGHLRVVWLLVALIYLKALYAFVAHKLSSRFPCSNRQN